MQEDDKAAVDALENSQIQAVTAFIRGNAVPPGDQGPRSVCYHRWMKFVRNSPRKDKSRIIHLGKSHGHRFRPPIQHLLLGSQDTLPLVVQRKP